MVSIRPVKGKNMSVLLNLLVIGLVPGSWKDKEGTVHQMYTVNYSQNGGQIVGQIRVPEEVYKSLTVNKEYILEGLYTSGRNGNFLRVICVHNNNSKGGQA